MSPLKTLEEILVEGFNSMITEAKHEREAKRANKALNRMMSGNMPKRKRAAKKIRKTALGPKGKVTSYQGNEPDPEPMEENRTTLPSPRTPTQRNKKLRKKAKDIYQMNKGLETEEDAQGSDKILLKLGRAHNKPNPR